MIFRNVNPLVKQKWLAYLISFGCSDVVACAQNIDTSERYKTKSINWNVRPMCLSIQWRLTQTIQVRQVHTHSHEERKKEIFRYIFCLVLYSRHLCKSTLLLVRNIKSSVIKKKDPNALSAQDRRIGVSFNGVEWRMKLYSQGGIDTHTHGGRNTNETYDLIWLGKFGTFHFTAGYAQLDTMHTCSNIAWLTWLVRYAVGFSYWINGKKIKFSKGHGPTFESVTQTICNLAIPSSDKLWMSFNIIYPFLALSAWEVNGGVGAWKMKHDRNEKGRKWFVCCWWCWCCCCFSSFSSSSLCISIFNADIIQWEEQIPF